MKKFLYSKVVTDRDEPLDVQLNSLMGANVSAPDVTYDIIPLLPNASAGQTNKLLIIAYSTKDKKVLNEVKE